MLKRFSKSGKELSHDTSVLTPLYSDEELQFIPEDILNPHPLDGRFFKFKIIEAKKKDSQPLNTYFGIQNDLSMTADYYEANAMVLKLKAVKGRKDHYVMRHFVQGKKKLWVSFSDDGKWLYARYNSESDAMITFFLKCSNNPSGSSPGPTYILHNRFPSAFPNESWI